MPPLRPWGDFFLRRGFARPANFKKFQDIFISNLLYYQTNYLVVSTAVFIIPGFKEPVSMIKGLGALLGVFLFSVWAGEIQPLVYLKRWSPFAFLVTMFLVFDFFNLLVLYNETFALATYSSLSVLIPHASFRYRNIDEGQYHKEAEQLKGSPMGILLIGRVKKNTKMK
ncbi:PRA1 family protein 3 [Fundulus heteroclitus]|uniref:PRA1 family protein 3 n=1 Tax=Fundulus heteroclitus TaxID=8078 RepID=UPI00165B8BF5|nr:PRA1 family protein 3 [Fundulus heteroclitus]